MRQINDAGLALIREFEQGPGGGPALKAYLCPSGHWTIGFGHTGADVNAGTVITESKAETLLDRDLDHFEAGVADLLKAPANGNQYSAMVSLAFNIGLQAFAGSTVLRQHNAGNHAEAARAFALWNKGRNSEKKLVPLKGLTRRRAEEAALYLRPTEMEQEIDPQRTRAADVTPSSDPLAKAVKVGGGVVAAGTVAQQAVVQIVDVRDALGDLGIDPRLAMLALAVLVGAGLWYVLSHRNG